MHLSHDGYGVHLSRSSTTVFGPTSRYNRTIIEGCCTSKGDTQAIDRHVVFTSCGLMNRIEKLPVLGEKGKLKLLLVGSILTGNGEPTLLLRVVRPLVSFSVEMTPTK